MNIRIFKAMDSEIGAIGESVSVYELYAVGKIEFSELLTS